MSYLTIRGERMRSCAVCSRNAPALDCRTETFQTRCEMSGESGLSDAEVSRSPDNPRMY